MISTLGLSGIFGQGLFFIGVFGNNLLRNSLMFNMCSLRLSNAKRFRAGIFIETVSWNSFQTGF